MEKFCCFQTRLEAEFGVMRNRAGVIHIQLNHRSFGSAESGRTREHIDEGKLAVMGQGKRGYIGRDADDMVRGAR